MKTIAVIPARGGSKRLPGKNVKLLGGIPLISHSIRYAMANRQIIDEIFVSTDCPEIKCIALSEGAAVIDRPSHLSGDHEPTVSALKHVLEVCGMDVGTIVLLQPTNPLRPVNLLQECFDLYQRLDRNSLCTVSRSNRKLGKISADRFIPFNYVPGQRSQDLEPLFFENGLLYISDTSVILKGEIISADAYPFLTEGAFSDVDIDTEEDFRYAEYLYNEMINNVRK